jgi:PleD family two-component response regulator
VKLDNSAPKITRRVSLEPLATPKIDNDLEHPEEEKRLGHSFELLRDERTTTVLVSSTNASTTPDAQPPETKDGGNKPPGLRVLLADDNATNLEVLSRMLLLESVYDVQLAVVRSPPSL